MYKIYFFAFLFITFVPLNTLCQRMEAQQTLFFSSRLSRPISIQVEKGVRNDLTFMAQNNSFYPYEVEVQFTTFINLSPMKNNYKCLVHPGSNALFILNPQNANDSYNYAYTLHYTIGDHDKKPDILYSYLIPLASGKEIQLMTFTKNNKDSISFGNIFQLKNGDTIFCMRKGFVTATPDANYDIDRIQKGNSIEILHADGTVATYTIDNTAQILVSPGKEVYPLQPLAIIHDEGILTLELFQVTENGLRSFDFKYEGGNATNGKIVNHSSDLIDKELTKKEKKKMADGELY